MRDVRGEMLASAICEYELPATPPPCLTFTPTDTGRYFVEVADAGDEAVGTHSLSLSR